MIVTDVRHVVVVGAGIVGLTCAFEILRTTEARVTMIDRTAPLAGASGLAGAGDLPLGWSARHDDLIERSAAWHRDILGSGPWRTRHLTVWRNLSPRTRAMIAGGTSALDESAFALVGGLCSTPWLDQAVDLSWSHRISPTLLAQELLRRMQRTNRLTVTRGEVLASSSSSDRVVLTLAGGREVGASAAIVAVGGWIHARSNPWRLVAQHAGVRTKRVHGFRARMPRHSPPSLMFADADEGIFAMPATGPGRIALSVKHDEWDVPAGTAVLPDEILGRGLDFLRQNTPWWPVRAIEPRVHVDTYTESAVPVVAEASPGVAVVTGTHGSGIRLSPALAQDAVALALSGSPRVRAEAPQ